MDLIEPSFRPRYEKISVGNKTPEARHIFFEGLLLQEGLGMEMTILSLKVHEPSVNNILNQFS